MPNDSHDDAAILAEMISALKRADEETRERLYETLGTFFQLKRQASRPSAVGLSVQSAPLSTRPSFSTDRIPAPKEFLIEKRPRTDVERVACLAYYLLQYRDQPHFSTLDLSKLNTEAAQRKFANAAWAVANAVKLGYLVPAQKGTRQLSASGERFVQMLPDYEAARAAMLVGRQRRRSPRKKNGNAE